MFLNTKFIDGIYEYIRLFILIEIEIQYEKGRNKF